MGREDFNLISSKLEKVEFQSQKLLEAASAVLQAENFVEGARAVFDIAKELTGAQSGYVALLSEDGSENEVLFLDAGGLPCTVDESLPMPIRGLRSIAYRENSPAYDNSFMDSEWVKFMPEGHVDLQNVMFGPLVIAGKAEGLIGLANKPTPFTEEDAKTVMALSNLVAIGLRRNKVENELRVSRRKLLETATELDLYTSLLRHDLINDLQVIFGELDIAGTLAETDGPVNESLTTIENVSNRMLRLLQSLSKSSNKFESDLREVIETVIQDARGSYPSAKIIYHDNCEIEKFSTTGRLLLPFVFENLIRNASQHVDNLLEIKIIMHNDDKNIMLDLVDNGPGIPVELRDTLFDRGTSTKEEGGLGLYLSRKIVETYGGKMYLLEDEYDKGAAFRIELPYIEVKETKAH
ncbi:MAG: GAF domain-containing protein [Candidatus Lokiarchaeota archaeon]|nr:GAF domain-containing protein [Candidatus Lokiarchaeota archaeon]